MSGVSVITSAFTNTPIKKITRMLKFISSNKTQIKVRTLTKINLKTEPNLISSYA
jgi:hypothetical protein